MDTHILGTPVSIHGEWKVGGVLTDPTAVFFDLRRPDDTETTYQFGVHAEVVKDGVGQYHAVVTPSQEGLHHYRLRGTGTAAGAFEGEFWVESEWAGSPAYTYDLETDVGVVRLLTDDRDLTRVSEGLPLEQRSAVWTDAEIAKFVEHKGGDVLLAAAHALRVLAANRQLLVQSRRIGQTTVDYGSVRADLLRQAEAYEEQAIGQGVPADAIVEVAWNDFVARDILYNAAIRTRHDG